jgi:hypothetical protein
MYRQLSIEQKGVEKALQAVVKAKSENDTTKGRVGHYNLHNQGRGNTG